jgi:hypothetical protein
LLGRYRIAFLPNRAKNSYPRMAQINTDFDMSP